MASRFYSFIYRNVNKPNRKVWIISAYEGYRLNLSTHLKYDNDNSLALYSILSQI